MKLGRPRGLAHGLPWIFVVEKETAAGGVASPVPLRNFHLDNYGRLKRGSTWVQLA